MMPHWTCAGLGQRRGSRYHDRGSGILLQDVRFEFAVRPSVATSPTRTPTMETLILAQYRLVHRRSSKPRLGDKISGQ